MADDMNTGNGRQQIYRRKSIEKAASPEVLNRYIKVTRPGIWLVLCAIVILLAGMIIWALNTTVETKARAVGIADNGNVICCVGEADGRSIKKGMTVRISGTELQVSDVRDVPVRAKTMLSKNERKIIGVSGSDPVYIVDTRLSANDSGGAQKSGAVDNGSYPASIVMENIHVMEIVFN